MIRSCDILGLVDYPAHPDLILNPNPTKFNKNIIQMHVHK